MANGAIGPPGRVVKCPVEQEGDSGNESAIVHLLKVAVAIAEALLKPSNRVHQTRVHVSRLPVVHSQISKFRFAVDGGWSSWTRSTSCSRSCGGGTQQMFRQCNDPSPNYGGRFCAGFPREVLPCNDNCCPGNFSVRNRRNS